LIGVVFGGQSAAARDRHMAQLLDAAFSRAPGSAGVEMANLPEQNDEDEAPAVKPKNKTAASQNDYRAVMKAMASAQAGHVSTTAKPAKLARAKAVADNDDDASGDADDDNWGIQVGAYAQQSKAKQAATAARHKLGKLVSDGEISIARSGKPHASYRARLIGLPEETAREACRRLNKSHISCAVVNAG
jgi:D-alanyl-D-alanine carboxypeptidase